MEDNISLQESSEMPDISKAESDNLAPTSEENTAANGSNVCQPDKSDSPLKPNETESSLTESSAPVSPIPFASHPAAVSSSGESSAPVSPIPPASQPPLPCPPSVSTCDPHNYPYLGLQVQFPPVYPPPPNPSECRGAWSPGRADAVKMVLENEDLWEKFSEEGIEMVVAKSGRRMFPQVKVRVTGLNPDTYYFLMLDMIRVDEMKYRFCDRRWKEGQPSKELHSPTIHVHPQSPCLGRHWMDKPVVFENIRLTNDSKCRSGEILLSSMHKYVVRVHIIAGSDITQLYHKPALSFTLRQTAFIAVTAYQNERLKKLKIETNPFSRRFHKQRKSLSREEESGSSKENSPDSSEWVRATESSHISPEIQNLAAMAERLPPVSPIFQQLHEPAIRMPEWPYSRPLSIITDFEPRSRNADNVRYPVYQRYQPYPLPNRCGVPMCNMCPANTWPYDPYALQWYYYNMMHHHQQYGCYPDSTMRPDQQCHVTSSGL